MRTQFDSETADHFVVSSYINMEDYNQSWLLLGLVNRWITLFVALECFSISTLFFMCGYRASLFPAYSQIRSFIMTTFGFWFLADGIVKIVRFFEAKMPAFSAESIYVIFSRFGTAIVGIAAIYGLVYLYRGIIRQ